MLSYSSYLRFSRSSRSHRNGTWIMRILVRCGKWLILLGALFFLFDSVWNWELFWEFHCPNIVAFYGILLFINHNQCQMCDRFQELTPPTPSPDTSPAPTPRLDRTGSFKMGITSIPKINLKFKSLWYHTTFHQILFLTCFHSLILIIHPAFNP